MGVGVGFMRQDTIIVLESDFEYIFDVANAIHSFVNQVNIVQCERTSVE